MPDDPLRHSLGWAARFDYSNTITEPMRPTPDHLALLAAARWQYSPMEFGAVEMDGTEPYGNRDVTGDLARLLPHLSEVDRIRRHCELPAVLAYIATKAKEKEW